MSTTYPQLTETVFPNAVDSMSRMSDITADEVAYVQQYYAYYNAGNLDAAAKVILDHSLENKVFNAAKFNKIVDGIVAMQRFFREDAYAFKDEYSDAVTYRVGNIVFVSEDGCAYICKQQCTGIQPVKESSSDYWGLICLRGKIGPQGLPGAGALPSDIAPLMNGAVSSGIADTWSRSDHVHPPDTSRAEADHQHSPSDLSQPVPVTKGGTGTGDGFLAGGILIGNNAEPVSELIGTGALYATSSGKPTFGTLPVSLGGTGATTLQSGGILRANGEDPVSAISGVGVLYATTSGTPAFGTAPVTVGGTGKNTHTENSVLVGNGSSAVQNITSASGAFYATSTNGKPLFGTLPVAQGGTGGTTAASARKSLGVPTITVGTAAPSGGSVGDIYLQY